LLVAKNNLIDARYLLREFENIRHEKTIDRRCACLCFLVSENLKFKIVLKNLKNPCHALIFVVPCLNAVVITQSHKKESLYAILARVLLI